VTVLRRRFGASRGGDSIADEAGPQARTRGGLTRRLIAASVLLALIVGGAFVVVLSLAIFDLRDAGRRTYQSQRVLVAANELERLLLDLETGQRGFILTRQERFLEPWTSARAQFPVRADTLLRLVAGDPVAERRAAQIAQDERAYISQYSEPLVRAARRGDPSARSVSTAAGGKRRVDAMRAEFDQLLAAERRASASSNARAETAARRAAAAAVAGLAGSIALIVLYAAYLARAIVRPVRRAATMADHIAGGDLSARMPQTGPGEVGALERTFNVMARSLEHSRDELAELAAEQAALRRVATLVAQEVETAEVFEAVAREVGLQCDADFARMERFEPDQVVTAVAGWSRSGDAHLAVGTRFALEGASIAAQVRETDQPARLDSFEGATGPIAREAQVAGIRSSVGCPIVVGGRTWGVIAASTTRDAPFPPDTESRIADFTELAATAIANAEAREELRRVADEQAALRRVATLVAQAAAPRAVFAAVAEEVGRLLGADVTALGRYEPEGAVTSVATWTGTQDGPSIVYRTVLGDRNVSTLVFQTGRPARVDSYEDDATIRARTPWLATTGAQSSVGAPISVEDRLWGVMIVASTTDVLLPRGTEERLADFTELVATAIANAESQAELTASRARIVATADDTRRRIERDLHDGAQQRLVSLALQLRGAQAGVPPELGEVGAELADIAVGMTDLLDELREMARGIHPAILAEGGLGPALKTLARRSPVPVELNVQSEGRLSEPIEVGAYYVVSEALTNAAKHANASSVAVDVEAVDGVLRLCVRDDGDGGADFGRGSGLVGLKDRVEALGGRIAVESARGRGTALRVDLPLSDDGDASG
jgi:signal transduction histidine kinase/CHASE3 domain sensor protein